MTEVVPTDNPKKREGKEKVEILFRGGMMIRKERKLNCLCVYVSVCVCVCVCVCVNEIPTLIF